jgi:hypothetical protein
MCEPLNLNSALGGDASQSPIVYGALPLPDSLVGQPKRSSQG